VYHKEGVDIDIICIMWWCATVHCHWTCLCISWLITNLLQYLQFRETYIL